MPDVTAIITRMSAGDPRAAEELLPIVYDELRRLAAQRLQQEKPGQTLQPTALVHEAYLRLVQHQQPWDSRGHFFAAAAEAMRRILIDQARRKRSERHGGNFQRHDAQTCEVAAPVPSDELLAVHESLERLQAIDPLKAELVKLRYFAGMTLREVAEVLRISAPTADRYWAFARAWLHADMRSSAANLVADCP
ncbi:MAG TPA: sigma-70 family RNA polymerase sigma factor, partial [Pirellulaceae bacterium]